MKEKICKTCMWWCGDESDEKEFCDEKEIPTSAENYCPKWHERPDPPSEITDFTEKELKKLIESKKSITDSDIEDFCYEHNVSRRAIFHQLAEWSVPETCRGCEHVDMYPNMPPCSSCSRSHPVDHYQKAMINTPASKPALGDAGGR